MSQCLNPVIAKLLSCHTGNAMAVKESFYSIFLHTLILNLMSLSTADVPGSVWAGPSYSLVSSLPPGSTSVGSFCSLECAFSSLHHRDAQRQMNQREIHNLFDN